MKYLVLFTLFISFFSTTISTAQDIRGVILNSRNQPLEGAYIYNKNSEIHSHSLENGTFVLKNSKVGDSINISYLGFQNKILLLKKSDFNSKLNIVLTDKIFQLDELVISKEISALSTIVRLDLNNNPVNSSQEVLRKVPGLIIGQHAGGGKAEQLFLRGFDIDHGTDIALSVDGIPVNMVSHAHGQGYSDLHFLIPETINKIDFGKGPYYAKKGDFNTAGYVDFSTKDYLNNSSVSSTIGRFNTLRTLGLFNVLEHMKNQNAYLAIENVLSDGPFESPQNFNRLNLFGKYVFFSPNNDKLGITVSHFNSRWSASGQIPQRAVNSGSISRFGAIDDTEGGKTQRTNINGEFLKLLKNGSIINSNVFYSHYDFELYSNFTFFLEDPVNGDQIKQKEKRNILGFNTAVNTNSYLAKNPFNISYGLGLRHDITTNSELSKTINKAITKDYVQFGDINQTNLKAFINTELELGKLKIAPGLRLDYFKFLYDDKLKSVPSTLSETKTIISPKLNIFYTLKDNMQWFFKSGIGFHSNDARVIVNNQQDNTLPRAYGVDFGNIWKPLPKLVISAATWYLLLEQEFVYVGDAGIVEPSGKTERFGFDFGLRYQFNDWLYFNTDATYTKARDIEALRGEDYIPLAPDFTLVGGLSLNDLHGFSGGLTYRYVDDRPANSDGSLVAEGYLVCDLNATYNVNKHINIGMVIENLFNVDWNETQFATTSRLQNETQGVEEIHFTPGIPFFLKGTVTYTF